MKKNERHIGGITTGAGITFVGLHTKVTIRHKDGAYIIKHKYNPQSNTLYNKLQKTPFIRGFIKLYKTFKMAVGTLIGKISLGLIFISFIFLIIGLFIGEPIPTSDEINTLSSLILNVTNIIIILSILFYTLSIRNLHGLEHKLIQTYNKGLELNLNNVKNQSKETPQCGGTLLGIIIFINILWINVFHLPSLWVWLLIPSIGFELFLIAKNPIWYSKILYFPGYLIQLISTGNNISDDTILKYLDGFKAFIIQETKYDNK